MAFVPLAPPLMEALNLYRQARGNSERFAAVTMLEGEGDATSLVMAGEMCLEMAARAKASVDDRSALLLRAEGDWQDSTGITWDRAGKLPVAGRALTHLAALPEYEWHIFHGTLLPRPKAKAVYADLLKVGDHYLKTLELLGVDEVVNPRADSEVRQVGGDISELELVLTGKWRTLRPKTRSALGNKSFRLSPISDDRHPNPARRYDVAVEGETVTGHLETVSRIQSKGIHAVTGYDKSTVTVISPRLDLRLGTEKRGRKAHIPLSVGTILAELVGEPDHPEFTDSINQRAGLMAQKMSATKMQPRVDRPRKKQFISAK